MTNKEMIQELIGNAGTVLHHVRGNMKTGKAIWKVEMHNHSEKVLRWMMVGMVDGELVVMSTDPIPEKKARKASTAPTIVDGGVLRIGRNYLPTRTWSDGRLERNRKVDGTGEWVTVNA